MSLEAQPVPQEQGGRKQKTSGELWVIIGDKGLVRGQKVWTKNQIRFVAYHKPTNENAFEIKQIFDSGWLKLRNKRTTQILHLPPQSVVTRAELVEHGILK